MIDWKSIPFYVVGEATATALADLARQYNDSYYVTRNVLGGAESGTAEKLAHYILDHHPLNQDSHPTFLYLTGDKNRDTLPTVLASGGITLRTLQVYETRGSSTFAKDLENTLSKDTLGMPNLPMAVLYVLIIGITSEHDWWIVYFAPSSAD